MKGDQQKWLSIRSPGVQRLKSRCTLAGSPDERGAAVEGQSQQGQEEQSEWHSCHVESEKGSSHGEGRAGVGIGQRIRRDIRG